MARTTRSTTTDGDGDGDGDDETRRSTTAPVSRIEIAVECDASPHRVSRAIAIGENPPPRGGRQYVD
jgi:hypothetical protein